MRILRKPVFWWGVLFILTWALSIYAKPIATALDMKWLVKYPSAWVFPLKGIISDTMKWLVEDEGLFTMTTRAISWMVSQPYDLVRALLADGFNQGQGRDAVQILPPLSWITVIAMVMALGHYAKSWGLAVLVGAAFAYLAIFGQWQSAMITLASVMIAVPIGVIGGLMLGILAYRYPRFDRMLTPALDLMQTIPIFAYLVPILLMFGFNPVSALVATVIYAMPPMVRITTKALNAVDPEIKDFGQMTGCTRSQMTWRILVPAAQNSLMVGVNQVIMLSLNMVIIASMIGAGGLGFDVLASLRKLDIGGGFEAGIAIVVLAIAIDRLSQAFAERTHVTAPKGTTWLARHPRTIVVGGVLIAALIIGYVLPAFQTYPKAQTLTTGAFWDNSVKYLNINFYDQFEAVKIFFLKGFMLPLKRFLLGVPWPWMIGVIVLIGWRFGGWKLALMNLVMAGFIVSTGLWAKAMISVYLCGASVILACIIGIPFGVLAAVNERAGRIIGVVIDTLQTLPSFVYLIPVVMLLGIGDFTAMIAIVLYALAPAVRYTAHGVRSVNADLIEAGIVSGCTRRQLLTRIRLPLALPDILLGINQTIMLALSMLVITALVGSRDLGQEVYIALAKADTGRGIVAGLGVAFIAIIADRIISASARNARIRYGLEAAA
ncbi:Glycine betaine ABC transport system, permease protein OpuAB / Glycine betaine ABC transport system, permease protein OpuAB [hydrothermal vent metagenome]|uniref:Glycine betaine ABC transport system, permease protein OpuAB / Glycine betaine ABC transport system, permease protein OpuAB n=1 Tax=hydrothermal vent metagenome TaxID=652676 RepID=A0A3B0RU79_9ZZZZ